MFDIVELRPVDRRRARPFWAQHKFKFKAPSSHVTFWFRKNGG